MCVLLLLFLLQPPWGIHVCCCCAAAPCYSPLGPVARCCYCCYRHSLPGLATAPALALLDGPALALALPLPMALPVTHHHPHALLRSTP